RSKAGSGVHGRDIAAASTGAADPNSIVHFIYLNVRARFEDYGPGEAVERRHSRASGELLRCDGAIGQLGGGHRSAGNLAAGDRVVVKFPCRNGAVGQLVGGYGSIGQSLFIDSLVGDGERDLAYRSASTQPSACHHGRDETDSAPCGGGNREGSAILIDPDIGSGLKLDLATAAVEAQHGSVVCELGGGHGVIGDLLGRYGPGSDGRAVYCPASDSVGHGCPQREE